MAYAALISLNHTIVRLVNHPRISIDPPCPEIESVLEQTQEFMHQLESTETLRNWDGKIKGVARALEDAIESHLSVQLLSQFESTSADRPQSSFKIDLQDVESSIGFDALEKIRRDYCEEEGVSSIDFGRNHKSDDTVELLNFNHYAADDWSGPTVDYSFEDPSILRDLWQMVEKENDDGDDDDDDDEDGGGNDDFMMGGLFGIGKTSFIAEIFDDPLISRHFSRRAWVEVGPEYQPQEIMLSILVQINPNTTRDQMLIEADGGLANLERLVGSIVTRFLIVLDDVWNTDVWDELSRLLPDCKSNGSRVLLTTRNEAVARTANYQGIAYQIPFLNEEESWCLLRKKVFGDDVCPPQLVKAGKKIAKNCEGLPLTVVTVSYSLSISDKTVEYWNKVAEKNSLVFINAYEQMSDVLFPSYNYLPQRLKACFLFLGVFYQNYEIPFSKLVNLWSVEQFLQPDSSTTFKDYAVRCLEELVCRCVVLVGQMRSVSDTSSSIYAIKTCTLHSSFWYLCKREAGKSKFFHVLKSYADGLADAITSQRRLCIHNNILFGIEDVHTSMLESCGSTARSLLCFGPHHQYPVPICLGLRLLRILDALTIHLYEFPLEVLKLVLLRYLALTFNGELPLSISKLCHLEYLIVFRTLSIIKSSGAHSYLPMEIWDMKELKRLQFVGSDLPDPCEEGSLLPNLVSLVDVGVQSCTKGVLEGIPNLRKLGIRIELAPDATEPPLKCFDHISCLQKLESLKCIVVNPNPTMTDVLCSRISASIFPEHLKKLTLSGFGYPWKEMRNIASLPRLQVLKLQCYAFRGPIWETRDNGFASLRFLLIEDTDLEIWRVGCGSFENLKSLAIKHCYKLQEFPYEFCGTVEKVEIVDCNTWALNWAQQIQEIWYEEYRFGCPLDVKVHSSWDDDTDRGLDSSSFLSKLAMESNALDQLIMGG
ncbi:hypothetical protein ACP275_04G151700 [Erythranthe tilingii]